MADYIKREELEQKMYHEAFENDAQYDEKNPMAKWDSGLWIRFKLFENVLERLPSADVVEREAHEKVVAEISKRKYAEGYEQARQDIEGKIKLSRYEKGASDEYNSPRF